MNINQPDYKGFPIQALHHYSTPYYFTPVKRGKNGKLYFGPLDNFRSIKALERKIDNFIKDNQDESTNP